MIGIIGAMKIEVEITEASMTDKREEKIAGIRFVSGKLHGKDIVTAVCGIGKVAAAFCTQAMIMRYRPDCIINSGVAGSLSEKIGILDIVIADTLVEHDMDTSPIGDPRGMISGINIIDIPTDDRVRTLLLKSAESLTGCKVVTGKIASGDQFVSDEKTKKFIVDTFSASACEMEGAAIAHTCYCNKMPVGVVRAISDTADGSSEMDYSRFLPKAAAAAAEIISGFVRLF